MKICPSQCYLKLNQLRFGSAKYNHIYMPSREPVKQESKHCMLLTFKPLSIVLKVSSAKLKMLHVAKST